MEKQDEFFGEGWAKILKPYLTSEYFYSIGHALRKMQMKKEKIFPEMKNVFRAFKECPFENMHSVILYSGPYSTCCNYSGKMFADGLALSCNSKAMQTPNALTNIRLNIRKSIPKQYLSESTPSDLTPWANQGILLLNCSLTTTQNALKTAHEYIWRGFINYVIKVINKEKPDAGWLLIGDFPQTKKTLITSESCAIYECADPEKSSVGDINEKDDGLSFDPDHAFASLVAYQSAIRDILITF